MPGREKGGTSKSQERSWASEGPAALMLELPAEPLKREMVEASDMVCASLVRMGGEDER